MFTLCRRGYTVRVAIDLWSVLLIFVYSMPSFDFAHAPGHLIRRAHQVSAALFMSEAAALEVTQVQFALLNALLDTPGVDQVSLAQRVALDPATSGAVIGRLEGKGWLSRTADPDDRRRRRVWITAKGVAVVEALMEPIARSQARLVEPLLPAEREELQRLLLKLVLGEGGDPRPSTSTATED